MQINRDDYINAMNANFCGGVEYACEELKKFMTEKKRTLKDIEKWCDSIQNEAIDTRKSLIFKKKVNKKVSILH